ncbi:siderophore-interacting protein [Microbacterium sediminicola]|uniref:siderophore-interacting protein n=1 Tax=Microbacterium sediminicola TaxID=415210 RepID=UPI0031DAA804
MSRPVEAFARVTVTGPDFADFVSTGPADHCRLFFPDPASGVIVAPRPLGPGEDGIIRPDQPAIARDFTPLNPRAVDDSVAIDLDFLQHPDPGPASAWGESAMVGDTLVVVGPRGSREAPTGAARAVLVVDGSALPSAGRWLASLPDATAVEVVYDGDSADLGWVGDYLAGFSPRGFGLFAADGPLDDAARARRIDEGMFVFGAGEAGRLIPLRRLLRRELGLASEQVALSGYWKAGAHAFDHHSALDPDDPD